MTMQCHRTGDMQFTLMARVRSHRGQGDQAREIFLERNQNWSELVVFLHSFTLIHAILCNLFPFWKREVIWSQDVYLLSFFFFFASHPSALGRTSFLIAVHRVYLVFCSLFFVLYSLSYKFCYLGCYLHIFPWLLIAKPQFSVCYFGDHIANTSMWNAYTLCLAVLSQCYKMLICCCWLHYFSMLTFKFKTN